MAGVKKWGGARVNPNFSVRVVGIAGLIANLHSADKRIQEEIRILNETIAQRIVKRAKELVPVDTGRTKRAVGYTLSPKKLAFTVDVDQAPYKRDDVPFYAPYLEHGTKKMAARPFIAPAYEAFKDQWRTGLKKAVQRAIARKP